MKWVYFLLGFLPSVIIVMVAVLTVSEGAFAVPKGKHKINQGGESLVVIPAGTGAPAGGPGGPSGGVTTMNSGLWMVYTRPPSDRDRRLLGGGFQGNRITVASYKAEPWGGSTRQGAVKYLSVREVSWDLKLVGYDRDTAQEVDSYRREWEKALKRFEKRK